jgi:hypothetical protein
LAEWRALALAGVVIAHAATTAVANSNPRMQADFIAISQSRMKMHVET